MMPNLETPDDENRWKAMTINSSRISYPTRAAALEAAHDMVKEIDKNYNCPVVEYGAIEL